MGIAVTLRQSDPDACLLSSRQYTVTSKYQASAARLWLDSRQTDRLTVDHFHVVFTLPALISEIAHTIKTIVYALLFKVPTKTLATIAADRRHQGVQIGATLVPHSWG